MSTESKRNASFQEAVLQHQEKYKYGGADTDYEKLGGQLFVIVFTDDHFLRLRALNCCNRVGPQRRT